MTITPEKLIEHFDGPRVSVPMAAIRLFGCIKIAAFIQQAAYLTSLSSRKGGWFDLLQTGEGDDEASNIFSRLGSWQACLGLSPDEQVAIRRRLRAMGLLEERRIGIPARLHFRVPLETYLQFISDSEKVRIQIPEKSESGCRKSRNQESEETRILS